MFSSVNTCWTLVGAFLVYFMQAGFALCEAGFTRAKNTGNILMKNMMDFCIGTPCYWLIGFGLMFGGTGALIGGFDPFIQGDYSHLGLDIPLWVYIVFQTVFCATAATIVSGSMAERTNFKAYCVYSAAISLVVYPICGHWMWGGGWLQSMGFHDFAGSAAVHNVGGVIALLGAWMLGPRIGKYDKDGNPHAIPGHNLTAGALGVFILWFCWFGFNGGSSLSLSTDATMTLTGLVCFNTNLAAAVATCVTMIFTWLRYGKPDVSMTLNGSLAGLVAITAGCDTVSPFGAFFIGFVAGILVVLSVEFFDKIAKVDDPVGAVSVHFANGVWGTIAVGLFSTGSNTAHAGLFYGGGLAQLGTQLLGLVCVDAYVVIVMFIIFKIIDKTLGLRVPAEVEIAEWTKAYDPTRLVNPASGGNHYLTGDMLDLHNYPEPSLYLYDANRATVLGEFGGIGLVMKEHLWEPDRNWGYISFNSPKEVTDEYEKYTTKLGELIRRGFSAAVYTQTTDVEIEVNGLMTYDRKAVKVDEARIRKLNEKICNSLNE